MTVTEVLALSSDDLADRCGFGRLLPSGRLNGFRNMIELIKSQIRKKLISEDEEDRQMLSVESLQLNTGQTKVLKKIK